MIPRRKLLVCQHEPLVRVGQCFLFSTFVVVVDDDVLFRHGDLRKSRSSMYLVSAGKNIQSLLSMFFMYSNVLWTINNF